jgi:hypothetical protein
VGANVTEIVHVPAAETVDPQLFVCAKSPGSVPVIEILDIVRTPKPGLVSVIVFAALVVPVTWFPKAKVAGLSAMLARAPVPASETT